MRPSRRFCLRVAAKRRFQAIYGLCGVESWWWAVGSGVALARYSGDVLSPARLGKRFLGTGRVPLTILFRGAFRCGGRGISMNFGDSGLILDRGEEVENIRE